MCSVCGPQIGNSRDRGNVLSTILRSVSRPDQVRLRNKTMCLKVVEATTQLSPHLLEVSKQGDLAFAFAQLTAILKTIPNIGKLGTLAVLPGRMAGDLTTRIGAHMG